MSRELDGQIARTVKLKPIVDIAEQSGIQPDELELYGQYKAKINLNLLKRTEDTKKVSHLILVSAMTPTPAGEGKTTVSIGLAQGLAKLNQKVMLALREPSLGPVFGLKGGATGGGYSQVLPMEDINLHFTNDFHAIESAHNLISAVIDNHLFFDNTLGLDSRKITWRRIMDMNDRSLRNIVIGLGGPSNGIPRETGFDIAPSSEIMAILCLSKSYKELKQRIKNILIGLNYQKQPVLVGDLGIEGAASSLLKYALMPNLVQTIEGVPAIIHGGPFANIAQGANSIMATEMALRLADYVVTEAGFGFDLGAEKFFDIVARYGDFNPKMVVLVATIRALKFHGGMDKEELNTPNPKAAIAGFPNLRKHYENISKFGVPCIIALNQFPSDSEKEIEQILKTAEDEGMNIACVQVHSKGGDGARELGERIMEIIPSQSTQFKPLYDWNLPVEDKIYAVASEIYGAVAIDYLPAARRQIEQIHQMGYGKLPICIAKTQQSLSDNPKLLGLPKDFAVTVREVKIAAGAGFLIPITGDILRMPGLPKVPAANSIDIDDDGNITGIF